MHPGWQAVYPGGILLGRMTSLRSRRFSAVVALVLLPSIAPGLFGRECPHHLGHGGGHAGGAGHAGHTGLTGHAGHAHAPQADVPQVHPTGTHAPGTGVHGDAEPGHDDVPPPCTCVGSCPTSSGPATPTAPPPVALAAAATTAAPATPSARRPAPRRAPYTLPFANAPPLT